MKLNNLLNLKHKIKKTERLYKGKLYFRLTFILKFLFFSLVAQLIASIFIELFSDGINLIGLSMVLNVIALIFTVSWGHDIVRDLEKTNCNYKHSISRAVGYYKIVRKDNKDIISSLLPNLKIFKSQFKKELNELSDSELAEFLNLTKKEKYSSLKKELLHQIKYRNSQKEKDVIEHSEIDSEISLLLNKESQEVKEKEIEQLISNNVQEVPQFDLKKIINN